MIYVDLNRANYEYDINALLKSFYPDEEFFLITPETSERHVAQIREEIAARRAAGERSIDYTVTVSETETKVRIEEQTGAQSGEPDGATEAQNVMPPRCYTIPGGKDVFKRRFYDILCEITGRTLPWGNLTGIRPTKLALAWLEEGKSEEETLDFLRREHAVSEEKAHLALEIAQREHEILGRFVHADGRRGYNLYLGIPFCPTTCLYCSFTSYPIAAYRKVVDDYLDSLIRELAAAAETMRGQVLDTIYIGGGTPTTLEPEQLERLLSALEEHFDFHTVQEFTVEAGRADSITREKLEVLRRHGVGRISVNPQTMKQETLDLIGRKASVEQVVTAFHLARELGFDDINMDLILGLPGETAGDVRNTIERVVELAPDSLTVHSLAIKRASRLSQWIRENGVSMLNNTDETMEIAAEGARHLGLKPYYLYRQKNMSGNFENTGYARPGKYGLYNMQTMVETQSIIACGAGAISKCVYPDGRIERVENVREIAQYLARTDEMIERKRRLFAGL